ncbi:hypothetical protein KUTeg_005562 [Tegillarca granosa]|uniref:Uncharacterized protein n=1 Tax=Tegillarca granosa TaxID=220873 RepID=A0ABQ9FK31_TEGGR|nr:hypothetical protein KUTeg_005562 [Tegillarca granosa]
MLLKLVIIVIAGCVVIQVISQDCPALGVCVNNLELSSVIKDGDVCISRTGCDLTGLEPLYIAYRKLGYTINRYCSENVCPDLTSIEECWKQLDYSGIPKGEIYNVLVECLESFPVCPEVNTVLEYFYEGYSKLQEKCQTESPTTGSYPDMTTTENIVTSSPHKKITGEINVTITSTVPTSSHISTYIESSSVKERITKTRLVTSKSTELVTSTPSTKEYSSVSRQTSTFKPTTEKKIISTMLASVTNTTVNPTSIPTTKLITTKRADDKISSDGRRGTTLHIPSFSKGAVSTWHHKFLASFIFVILWFVL